MTNETLLEKARRVTAVKQTKPLVDTQEELDLMLALVRGEITSRQAAVACGKAPRSRTMYMAYRCFAALRDGIRAGKITITKNGE